MKKVIGTENAPKVVGPYSQGIVAGDFLFCSGQIGIDPVTNELVEGGILEQTKQVLKNLRAVLDAGGAGVADVVRAEIFLKDISDYQAVNVEYGNFFSLGDKPARQAVEVSALPKGALIEISCVAYLKKDQSVDEVGR